MHPYLLSSAPPLSPQADSFQIVSDSESSGSSLTNLVRLLGGFVQIRAEAECSAASDTRTSVLITEAGEGGHDCECVWRG